MSAAGWMGVVLLALAAILPLASLRGRRLGVPALARMGALWLAILIATALAFTWLGWR